MTKEELKQLIESEIKIQLSRPGQPTPQVFARPAGFGPPAEDAGIPAQSQDIRTWNIECGVTLTLTAGEHMSPDQVRIAIRREMLFFVGGS